MNHLTRIFAALTLGALVLTTLPSAASAASHTQRIVLAGGCFWGMQAVFSSLKGVTATQAGYTGGSAATANYGDVSSENTQQAESVQITYDPTVISFSQLLNVYFRVAHDPTEYNRQGPDTGPSYRSEIFYLTAQQRDASLAMIAKLQREHIFSAPIVTKVAHLTAFYPAEAYHQNFLVHNPDNPYIVANDLPKLAALRKQFPNLVNSTSAPIETLIASR